MAKYRMLNWRAYVEGARINSLGANFENVPKHGPEWVTILNWNVLFKNKMGLPEDRFQQLQKIDAEFLKKLIASMMSIGVRKNARIPIIFSYEVNSQDTGSYKSSDDYFVVYRNPDWPVEELVGTTAHEIGHAIWQRLDPTQHTEIYKNAHGVDKPKIPSYTRYTDPAFGGGGADHQSGNEWFADYVAATTMQAYGLRPETKVGSWEPIVDDPKRKMNGINPGAERLRGIKSTKQIIGNMSPSRTKTKDTAGFLLKNRFIFPQLNYMRGKLGSVRLGDIGVPTELVAQVGGPGTTAHEIVEEFFFNTNNRLEALPRDSIRIFLTTLRAYVDKTSGVHNNNQTRPR